MVHLTKIYTKTGDSGTTSLANNKRVSKNNPIVIAMGKIDTANSVIGTIPKDENMNVFDQIQNDLFDLGADLCGSNSIKISQNHIDYLEMCIDGTNALLEPLNSFVLPTGQIHHARSLVREAELAVWDVMQYMKYEEINPLLVIYLNRLSDLLFVLARYYNKGNEKLWNPTIPS